MGTFKSFASGIKISSKNAASEVFFFRIYLLIWRFSVFCWMKTIAWELNGKLIHLSCYLMLKRKKSFTCLFNNPDWSFKPNCSQNCVLYRTWKALRTLKTLSSKLKCKRNRRDTSAMEIKKDQEYAAAEVVETLFCITSWPNSGPVFPFKFLCRCWIKRSSCYW